MTVRSRTKDVFGVIAVIGVFACSNIITYVVKDILDSSERQTLRTEKDDGIKAAKTDADRRVLEAQRQYEDNARVRDQSIATLTMLVREGRGDRKKAIATSQLAAKKADEAKDASTQAAMTSAITQRTLQSATQPTALPPPAKPWIGGHGH